MLSGVDDIYLEFANRSMLVIPATRQGDIRMGML